MTIVLENILVILTIVLFASIYPVSAFTYYHYRRQVRLDKLNFDFVLLGFIQDNKDTSQPSGANGLYTSANETYNTLYSPQNFAIQAFLITVTTVLGFLLLFSPDGATVLQTLGNDTLPALRYGFLGSYIFSAQLVYRRYSTFDLQPSVYFYGTLNIIGGVFFNYALFETVKQITSTSADSATGLGGLAVGALAFALGYFPYLAVRFLNRIAYTALRVGSRREGDLGLGLIDGISIFHEVRLQDEGIDNIQNLVSARLDELLINTRFSAQQIVEWIDQGMLYLYLNTNRTDPNALRESIDCLTRMGIRGVTDLHEQWLLELQVQVKVADEIGILMPEILKNLSSDELLRIYREECARIGKPATTELLDWIRQLDRLYIATLHGPNTAYIHHYWRTLGRVISPYQQELADQMLIGARNRIAMVVDEFFPSLEDLGSGDKSAAYTCTPQQLIGIKESVKQNEQHKQLTAVESLGYARVLQASAEHNYSEAIYYYNQAIAHDPTLVDAYNDLAWLYVHDMKTNLSEAERLARTGLEMAEEQGLSSLDKAPLLHTLGAILLSQAEEEQNPQIQHDKLEESRKVLDSVKNGEIYKQIPSYGRTEVDRYWAQLRALEQSLDGDPNPETQLRTPSD